MMCLQKKTIYLKTPVFDARMRYREIEESFWFMATDAGIRENVIAKLVYDENQLSDYY